jgi:DNA-binding CsgD family transcriptional regulator
LERVSKGLKSRSRRLFGSSKNKKTLYDPVWLQRFSTPSFEDEVIARLDGDQDVDQWKSCGIDLSFLTERQEEILRLIADGLTYSEVAEILGVTDGTVKKHMLQLRKKAIKKRGNVIQLSFLTNDEE